MAQGYIFPLNDKYRGFQLQAQTYGYSRPSYHDGVDFGSTFYDGRKILAVTDGKIVYSGFMGGELGCVVVLEAFGHHFMYQEYDMSRNVNTVKTGDTVKQGDVVANWGNGSHLHFGVTAKGKTYLEALKHAYNDDGYWLDPIYFMTGGKANGKSPVSMTRPTGAKAKELEELFTKNTNTGGSDGGSGGGGTTTYNGHTINVKSRPYFKPLKIDVGNLKGDLSKRIIALLKIKEEEFEPQLLSPEFSSIRVDNGVGNSYDFNPKYLWNNDKQFLILSGGVYDSNQLHISIDLYNQQQYGFSEKEANEFSQFYRFNYGFFDTNTRSLTVISSATESYMQANKNQLDAQNKSFIENKVMLDKNINLNNDKTNLQNEMTLFNSDMGFYNSMINGGLSLIGGSATLLGGGLGLLGGMQAVGGLAQSGMGIYQSGKNRQYTQQSVELNSQANTLSNQQSKLAYNQSLRSFNASLKDMSNQPSSISQMGSDVSFPKSYANDTINVKFMLGSPELMMYSYNYLRLFGVITNKQGTLKEFTTQRDKYNYVKGLFLNDDNLVLNNEYVNSIKNIFSTGVRVWNYTDTIENDFLNWEVANSDR